MASSKVNFNYSNASHARNASGIKTVMSDINSDINDLIKALDGETYNNFLAAVKKNWAGADADKFLSTIDNEVKDVKKKINKYSDTIKGRLEADNRGFQKFQGTINF